MVEVLMVVMIIALVSTWAAIVIYQDLDKTSLQGTALALQRAARYAHLIASEKHHPCRIHLNLDEKTYWITVEKTGIPVKKGESVVVEDGILEVENVYSHLRTLPEKITFGRVQVEDRKPVASGEVTFAFHVDGTAQAGLIQLQHEDETRTLLIYPVTSRAELHAEALDALPREMLDLDSAAPDRGFK